MDDVTLDRERILSLFGDVAARLEVDDHPPATLVVVGGSFMALQGLRHSTADVDTVTRLTETVRSIVAVVAEEHGLRPDWLNDRAAGFAAGQITASECEVLFAHQRLIALGPPADFIFLMKLQAARAIDYDDMIALWPRCSFLDPAEAVACFYEAYPHEEPDPHLADFVCEIARGARGSG